MSHEFASATIVMTKEYFEESYSEWLRSRSRFRKWQHVVGATVLVLGSIVLAFTDAKLVGAVMVLAGGVEFVEYYSYRRRWIRGRLLARSRNEHASVAMSFDDAGISTKGPNAESRVAWAGVSLLTTTELGLFLSVGDGQCIYLPKRSLSPRSAVDEISRRSRRD